jgi:hypothetical protein
MQTGPSGVTTGSPVPLTFTVSQSNGASCQTTLHDSAHSGLTVVPLSHLAAHRFLLCNISPSRSGSIGSIMAASPMAESRVEPHKKAHFSLHISDRIASGDSPRAGYSSVKCTTIAPSQHCSDD